MNDDTLKNVDATENRPTGDRIIDAPQHLVDIDYELSVLRKENAWEKNDRNAVTVFKTNQLTIVLVALKTGASLLPHQVSAIASVQVLKGRAEFTSEEGQKELEENNIIILHSNELFNITALEETNILVTIIEEY